MIVVSIIVGLFVGHYVGFQKGKMTGWVDAHVEVARECKRLGGFYVGRLIFKCSEVKMAPEGSSEEERYDIIKTEKE